MNIILLERIRNLGSLGDQLQVKAGYARNFLIPKGKAVPATPDNIEYFEARRAELQQKEDEQLSFDKSRSSKLQDLQIVITARVSAENKLYGSVGVSEIVDAITEAGGDVKKQEIQLPNGPIRTLGDHQVTVCLHHGDIVTTVDVSIVAEEK